MDGIELHLVVAGGGFLIGLALGVTLERSQFCMMGAVADLALEGDGRRMRAWLLAMAVAIAASQGLQLAGLVDLGATAYLRPTLDWLGAIVGGAMFGFGMVIACGCGSRSLVALGTGDLRALVALLALAIAAYATMNGILALPRVWLEAASAVSPELGGRSLTDVVSLVGGDAAARATVTSLVVVALAWHCLRDAGFRATPRYWIAATVVGLLVACGWVVTGVIGDDGFGETRLVSLTFVAPVGRSLVYLMTYTGAAIDFGIGVVAGVLCGSFLSALASRSLRLQAFEDVHDLGRYLTGGTLMGVGGVMALGCTVGQGLTGISTLSLGSILSTLAIIGGGFLGARYLEQGSLEAALRATFQRG